MTSPHAKRRETDHEKAVRLAREKVNATMRTMFSRWGEARMAPAEDVARAKETVNDAEVAFEAARDELERLLAQPPGMPGALDVHALRGAIDRITRALERGETNPHAVFDHAPTLDDRDRPIPGLADVAWQHQVADEDVDVWTLEDARGSVVAKITHSSDKPAWTAAVLNASTGELD